MKMLMRLVQRAKKTVRSSKGETLMESIVSFLLLSILLMAVTSVIQTALKMTSISTQDAKATQDTLNIVTLSQYVASNPAKVTFTVSAAGISAEHNVLLNEDGGIIAFDSPV